MWAEQRWIELCEGWIEIRSSAPGLLTCLEEKRAPPAGARLHEGVVSVVIDRSKTKRRRLPALFFRQAALAADRDLGAIYEALERVVAALRETDNRPIFALHPCELDGRRGLYAVDLFNRSAYRRKLARLGMKFTADPFVRQTDCGMFECEDWGEFEPEFMVMGAQGDDSEAAPRFKGALPVLTVAGLRLGRITPDQLHLLVQRLGRVEALGSHNPAAVVAALRTEKA